MKQHRSRIDLIALTCSELTGKPQTLSAFRAPALSAYSAKQHAIASATNTAHAASLQ